jgi:two-component system OmpR family sensor kinase
LEEVTDQLSAEHHRKVEFRCEADAPLFVRVNEQSLQMILNNLIQNAVKYSKPHEEILVKTGMSGPLPYIEICDAGSGIDSEHLEKIFDPFFREKEAVERLIPGTGLGLAIVRKLTQESGIGIKVSSKKGQGSTFRLEFAS